MPDLNKPDEFATRALFVVTHPLLSEPHRKELLRLLSCAMHSHEDVVDATKAHMDTCLAEITQQPPSDSASDIATAADDARAS